MSKVSNKKIIYLIGSVLLGTVIMLALFFVKKSAKITVDDNISFNFESGFYNDPIDVEVSAGEAYFLTYTLDGTLPTVDSVRVDGPIHIEDASQNDNIWSMKKETSPMYYQSDEIYALPKDKVDKCTLLRVSAFDKRGNRVSSSERTYFVGFGDKPGYDNMYNVCVMVEPDEFFDEKNGIYTIGEEYRDIVINESSSKWSEGMSALSFNWFSDGRQSERVAKVDIFTPSNELIVSQNCGLRVRGSSSRLFPQKSLGVYARREYAGSDYFEYDFFDTGMGPHTFVFFNGGNDTDVKLMDYVILNGIRDWDKKFSSAKIEPCNLFIDGEYWGPMYIMEDLNADFLSKKYGLTEDNIRIIKAGAFKGDDYLAEDSTDLEDWNNLLTFIFENDMSLPENYNKVCSEMDVESFAQYAAFEMYIGNKDWHSDNNIAAWRTAKSEKGNKYSDKKWRFSLYDVNWSFFPSDEVYKCQDMKHGDSYLLVQQLARNEEFLSLFKNEITEIEKVFSDEKVEALVAQYSSIMDEPVTRYYKRFADKPGVQNRAEVEKEEITQYLKNRPSQMDELFEIVEEKCDE